MSLNFLDLDEIRDLTRYVALRISYSLRVNKLQLKELINLLQRTLHTSMRESYYQNG